MMPNVEDLIVDEIDNYSVKEYQAMDEANQESSVQYVCAPYGSHDGQSGGGDGQSSRIDKIFGGWLSVRIRDHKELVPIIKTVYQWNIVKNGKIITVWSKTSVFYSCIQIKLLFIISPGLKEWRRICL